MPVHTASVLVGTSSAALGLILGLTYLPLWAAPLVGLASGVVTGGAVHFSIPLWATLASLPPPGVGITAVAAAALLTVCSTAYVAGGGSWMTAIISGVWLMVYTLNAISSRVPELVRLSPSHLVSLDRLAAVWMTNVATWWPMLLAAPEARAKAITSAPIALGILVAFALVVAVILEGSPLLSILMRLPEDEEAPQRIREDARVLVYRLCFMPAEGTVSTLFACVSGQTGTQAAAAAALVAGLALTHFRRRLSWQPRELLVAATQTALVLAGVVVPSWATGRPFPWQAAKKRAAVVAHLMPSRSASLLGPLFVTLAAYSHVYAALLQVPLLLQAPAA